MRRHCSRNTTSRLNKLLLGNLRTNRERLILPSSQNKIKKKILSSLTNQHSVILPFMFLFTKAESTYHSLYIAISAFAREDLIAYWVRNIQRAAVVESTAYAGAIGGSSTHLTLHAPVCFAGSLTWLRCSRDPQVIFLAGYSKQTRKFCFKQVTSNKGQIFTVKKMTKLPFRALETQTLSSSYGENLTNFHSPTHTNFSPSR